MTRGYFLGEGFFFWVALPAFCKKENKQIKKFDCWAAEAVR